MGSSEISIKALMMSPRNSSFLRFCQQSRQRSQQRPFGATVVQPEDAFRTRPVGPQRYGDYGLRFRGVSGGGGGTGIPPNIDPSTAW